VNNPPIFDNIFAYRKMTNEKFLCMLCIWHLEYFSHTQLLTHLTQMSRTVAKSQKGYQINAGPFSRDIKVYLGPSTANAICAVCCWAFGASEVQPSQAQLSGVEWRDWSGVKWNQALPGYQVLHSTLINFALAQVVRA